MRRSHAREKEWAFLPNFVGLSIPSRTFYSQTTSFAANLSLNEMKAFFSGTKRIEFTSVIQVRTRRSPAADSHGTPCRYTPASKRIPRLPFPSFRLTN